MRISSRFTIAIHILTCIGTFENEYKITSEFLASSVNVNPVIIRKLLSQLREAGIISVKRGSGGASVAKPFEEITFLDIYHAVEAADNKELFRFHANPNEKCPVGGNIHRILDDKLERIQSAMEKEMREITLADVMRDAGKYI